MLSVFFLVFFNKIVHVKINLLKVSIVFITHSSIKVDNFSKKMFYPYNIQIFAINAVVVCIKVLLIDRLHIRKFVVRHDDKVTSFSIVRRSKRKPI